LFVEPLLGSVLLTLGAVALATGMMTAVLSATALAVREAVSIMSGAAVLDGTDGLLVGERQMGRARQVLWRVSREDIADGGHEASPCRRELIRV
jgi:hypothetical protein